MRLRPYYVGAHNNGEQAAIDRPVLGRLYEQPAHPAAPGCSADNQADELRLIACFQAEPVLGLNPTDDRAVNLSHGDEMFAQFR